MGLLLFKVPYDNDDFDLESVFIFGDYINKFLSFVGSFFLGLKQNNLYPVHFSIQSKSPCPQFNTLITGPNWIS